MAYILWAFRDLKKKRNPSEPEHIQESKIYSTGLIAFWLIPVGTFLFSYTLFVLGGGGGSVQAWLPLFSPVRWVSIILYVIISMLALYFHHIKAMTHALSCIKVIVILFSATLAYEGIQAIQQKNIKNMFEHYHNGEAVSYGIMLLVVAAAFVVFWWFAPILGKKLMKLNGKG